MLVTVDFPGKCDEYRVLPFQAWVMSCVELNVLTAKKKGGLSDHNRFTVENNHSACCQSREPGSAQLEYGKHYLGNNHLVVMADIAVKTVCSTQDIAWVETQELYI